jgi:hypothetical protein
MDVGVFMSTCDDCAKGMDRFGRAIQPLMTSRADTLQAA